ncbi:metallophosphoesterase [Ruminiclostridium herbifermentans]|uniref:Metallophosphoesterase n=1 Tax=Ruminiclostridium herbifermentans TaxID=2488810 RepID=A0A4U7JCI4_9FIRM|nr:metallophosphoesterase [Ruminiclostridium herbifermentans]
MTVIGMVIGLIIMLITLGSVNYYIALRLYQGINYIFPQINAKVYIGIFIFITLTMILGFARSLLQLPMAIKNIMGLISSYWMGILVYTLLSFIIADLALVIGSMTKLIPNPMPKSIRFYSGLIVVLLTIGTVGYGIYSANKIKHVSYDISLREKTLSSELKIAMISDLHLGAVNSENRIENMVREINNLKPDLVCIAGDIFDNDYYAIQGPDEISDLLKSITSTNGVYASLGNHDAGETLKEMMDFLERSNIKLLNDQHVIVDESLVLVGRLDSSPIGGFGGMSRKDLAEIIDLADNKLPVVVIDHNPQNIDEYGSGVDLILAGHTHKGQIFPGSLFTRAIYAVDYGHYQKDSNSPHVVVTSGVGTWGMPMRVGTNCEIVSIKLH